MKIEGSVYTYTPKGIRLSFSKQNQINEEIYNKLLNRLLTFSLSLLFNVPGYIRTSSFQKLNISNSVVR